MQTQQELPIFLTRKKVSDRRELEKSRTLDLPNVLLFFGGWAMDEYDALRDKFGIPW